MEEANLQFTEEALKAIAKKARERETGAVSTLDHRADHARHHVRFARAAARQAAM